MKVLIVLCALMAVASAGLIHSGWGSNAGWHSGWSSPGWSSGYSSYPRVIKVIRVGGGSGGYGGWHSGGHGGWHSGGYGSSDWW